MEPTTILPYYRDDLSAKARFTLFLASFGTLWLFIEPLTSFGFLRSSSLLVGVLTYASMLVVAILSNHIILWFRKKKYESELEFITFTVLSSSDGLNHVVRSPRNMQVHDFAQKFINHLSKGAGAERVRQLSWNFEPILQLKKDENKFRDVKNSLTLSQAGITEGSVCQIRGKPIKRDRVLFSKQVIQNENSNEKIKRDQS